MVGDPGLRTARDSIRTELRSGLRLWKWLGLALVFVGVVITCVGGVLLGMLLYGYATATAAWIMFAVGLSFAVVGNLIWQRARIISRRDV
jgi:drug/metabolite transporter (DMT)-like permease